MNRMHEEHFIQENYLTERNALKEKRICQERENQKPSEQN